MCGSLCTRSPSRVVQMCVQRAHSSSWQGPCASPGAPRAHSHPCEHSHALTAWGLCSTSASKHAFLSLRKGFAFGLTPLVHFRKSMLKHPRKDVWTEHRILSCSSALNMAFLFPFFCFCLTGRDASFLAWQLCRKNHNSPFCSMDELCWEVLQDTGSWEGGRMWW